MQTTEADFDIMAALQSGTAAQHIAVEQHMPFFKPGFSMQQYVATLSLFLGFFEPVEERLAALPAWHTLDMDLPSRMRSHQIRHDLHILGLSVLAIARLPRCQDLPPIRNLSNALGCLYVLEGSTLGGQLIARELARTLSIDETSGASFFLSRGSRTGDMWKKYCAVVRGYVTDPQKQEDTVTTAIETFEKFGLWMEKDQLNAQ